MDKSQLRDEIIRCGRDPCYFIRTYVKIKHPKRGLLPFEMFEYQEELIRDYVENRFNIVLKARQLGISEITAAYATWLMLFHREKNIVVIASKAETAKTIIRKVETALKKLPRWLMLADIKIDNRLSIELSNGSRIKAIATSGDAGRSEAVSFLILDEAAFISKLDELWTGLYPTVQAGGAVAVLSTPNGVGNKFHQLYVDAESGVNEFKPHRFMWWLHPERIADLKEDPDRPGFKTSTWFKNEIKSADMSPREVAQELECTFNGSGETYIQAHDISWLEEQAFDPHSRENIDRNLFVWMPPQKDEKYLVTADVARGDGRDYSSAIVWRSSNMEQMAEYKGKITVDELAKLLCDLGHRYNNALVVVENVGVGLACLGHLGVLGYENVYFSKKGDTENGQGVNMKWGAFSDDLVPGFTTSPKTRPLILSKMEEFIRNKQLIIRSKRFVEEVKTFVWNGGRAEAQRGHNDDLVMAAAMGAWIRDTYLLPVYAQRGVQEKMLNGIGMNRTFNDQIPGASKDPRHERKDAFVQIGTYMKDRNSMQVRLPRGKEADFSWLLKG